MNTLPIQNISAERAYDLITDGLPVIDSYINGKLKIDFFEIWTKELTIENCIVEDFEGDTIQFGKPVRIVNSTFKNCSFRYSYFLEGLLVKNCIFERYLDFQAGGHNKLGHSITIQNNIFTGFVNFFDCWYEGEIAVLSNKFIEGTNIESKKQLITFDVLPTILNNDGPTTIESENSET